MLLDSFIITRQEADLTLTAVLRQRLRLSWSQAKRLVLKRQIKLNNHIPGDPVMRMKVGMRIEVHGQHALPSRAVMPEEAEVSTARPAAKAKPQPKPNAANRPDSPRDASPRDRDRDRTASRDRDARAQSPRDDRPAKAKPTPGPKPTNPPRAPRPVPMLPSERIRYVDDFVVVVEKPAGMTTMRHAEEAAEFGERAKRFLPKTLADLIPPTIGTPDRKLISVHRIDRDTTGLVVFARNKIAAKSLMKQFREHTIERRYLALVRGKPTAGRIESHFIDDRGDGRRGSVITPGEQTQRAVTHVRIVEELGEFTLVECRLETGRTHQVRIHLGEMGCPLAGETVYDRPLHGAPLPDRSGAKRTMLHAAHLGFVHPETGSKMHWDSLLPNDMATLLEALRNPAAESAAAASQPADMLPAGILAGGIIAGAALTGEALANNAGDNGASTPANSSADDLHADDLDADDLDDDLDDDDDDDGLFIDRPLGTAADEDLDEWPEDDA
ncbi:RluA family pseudouridine synthase [Tuwongella immobilis]|uniref:Pseudouridine synthase RsuA/RluA-like domain-containing protein n=1 Tax=Tuwongella immobilis TaxID=692036 RepID=A0A6C2YLI4_9BACT|nr:RluA family pseudouridine synthase [Tuwongella immobilis]VIP02099.1 pseudouridine synthase : Pseudouridine synthase OS=Pirellula staleyi (strain ATCC 27377 / DSM 6068 / ICPB 4128) GN=Psta_0906 PE=3 SV=1: PseudoU_synth_2 [Tuwongella immobilis]VTS00383.1 pseudouridine synthase : Pseudouridine synthase OS=Pirellula staleyi (strain ATCC 27377 / DSM 6068 / ICPB 4128) GN=Psta_0906 PE=3 SV=1: PseudoU_synth_2 [Tuwongella immobilis]